MVKPVKHVTDWMVIADRLWATPCNESGVKDHELRAGEQMIRTSTVLCTTSAVCETRNSIYILHAPHPDTEKLTRLVVGYGLAPANATATAVADAMLETSRAWLILDLVRKYAKACVNAHTSVLRGISPPIGDIYASEAALLLEEIGRALGAKSIGPAQGENHG